MIDVTVAVATFGELRWVDLAHERAIPSAEAHGVPTVYVHGGSLHEARNLALDLVKTEWVCFLDADDELERRFFQHMAEGTADVRAPSVRYVRGGFVGVPHMPRVVNHAHLCSADCLQYGNWLVVGSVARTDLLRRVGGWRDWEFYEDWDLWVRCREAGATFEPIHKAVYRAHARPTSRNRSPRQEARVEMHRAIARANDLPVPA